MLIWPIDGTVKVLLLWVRVDLGNGSEEVLHIPQSSSTRASVTDGLM